MFHRVFNTYKEKVDASLLDCQRKISRLKTPTELYHPDLSIESIYKRLLPKSVDVVEKIRSQNLTSQEYFDLAMDYLELKNMPIWLQVKG
jgi:hypothetical protein